MAQRRMLARSVVTGDRFRTMRPKTQAFYLQLSVEADDDGFVSNVQTLARGLGCEPVHIEELERNGFLYSLGEGVVLLRHWKVNNTIQKDRYRPSVYHDLLRGFEDTDDGYRSR